MNWVLILGLLLSAKHFIADGPMQTPYQHLNKGKLGHPGGIMHAAIHGVFTSLIFTLVGLPLLGLVDFAVHYFVDLLKVRMTAKYKWAQLMPGRVIEPKTKGHLEIYSDWYFYALILDQCLHFATYIALIAYVVR